METGKKETTAKTTTEQECTLPGVNAPPDPLRANNLQERESIRYVVSFRRVRRLPAQTIRALKEIIREGNVLRGPLLVAVGCGTPCIAWVARNASASTCLQGTWVLLMVGIGAYWFVADVMVRARAARDRTVGAAQQRLSSLVLDDVLQQLFNPSLEGSACNTMMRIVGMTAATCVIYMMPAVTQENRLLLAQSALGLTAEQAESLLCRPGGAQLLWHLCHPSLEASSPPHLLESGASHRDSQPTAALECNTERANGDATLPEKRHETDSLSNEEATDHYCISSPLREDETSPKMVASDEPNSADESTPVRSPLRSRNKCPQSPRSRECNGVSALAISQRGEFRDGGRNGRRSPLSGSQLSRPQRRPRPSPTVRMTQRNNLLSREQISGVTSESPLLILRSILAEYLSKNYVSPNLPSPPPQALLERCLSVSLGVLCMQLLCSRRSRKIVSATFQASLLVTLSALATLSLGLLLILYGPEDEANTQGSTARNNEKLNKYPHALAHSLVNVVQGSLSNARYVGESWGDFVQRIKSVLDPPPQSSPSLNRGVLTCLASWALGLARRGWRTLETRVARPLVLHAVQRRHALSALVVVLLLARWKEQRRLRLQSARHPGQLQYRYSQPL
jgi:hypothetical protein